MSIPIEILKIKDELRDGFHILCRVHIRNKQFRMLIDTGSSITIFNIDKYKDISENSLEKNNQKLTSIGNKDIKSKYIIIEELKIDNIIINDYKTILINLDDINNHFKSNGEPIIDGILGGDILFKYNAIIDYNKREMTLLSDI